MARPLSVQRPFLAGGQVRKSRLHRRLTLQPPATQVQHRVLLPAETYHLDPPITVQPECVNEGNDRVMETHAVRFTEVQDARVFFTGYRWQITGPDGEQVVRWRVEDDRATRMAWRPHRRLKGTTLLFANSAGAHCYYHWMMEILPKLGLLKLQGIDPDSIDHFLVREITGEWQIETLAKFGIDRSRIVETAKRSCLQCDRILHLDYRAGINLKMHRFVPLWMKHEFRATENTDERLRLYITRPPGVRRGIVNEHEFLPLLEEAGFTRVAMEGMTVQEQVNLLARADVVMAAHGGALTNMMFCKPGIPVVELLSRHVYPFYYGLAAMCGHRYHAILQNPAEDYARLISHDQAQSQAGVKTQQASAKISFEVDVDAVRRMLDLLG